MKSAMNGDDRPATGADNARRSVRICAYEGKDLSWRDDTVAVERALEIHVAGAKRLITMCTPGADAELVAGLMHGDGVIRTRADIVYLRPAPGEADAMRLMLKPEARVRLDRVERNTLDTSACGVCAKPSFSPPAPGSNVALAAEQFGVTRVKFPRGERLNSYTHGHRLVGRED